MPESLGGKIVLPDASCPSCAKITGKFEQRVARGMFWALRLRMGIKGKRKRKKKRLTHWPARTIDGDKIENIQVEAGKMPDAFLIVEMPPAGLILGEPPRDTNPELKMSLMGNKAEIEAFAKSFDAGRWQMSGAWDWDAFNQLLAKIAHALTVAICRFEGLEYLLVPMILGEDRHFPYLIGGIDDPSNVLPAGYDLQFNYREIRGVPYVTVRISLLEGRTPTYEVISARVTNPALIISKVR